MSGRIKLELRRARGWLAWLWVCHLTPISPRWLWWPFLSWAGLYAHWDYDRANWANLSEKGEQA